MFRTEKTAILMATYNAGEYIREQMDSILRQTYSDYAIYIHDDGSSDNTVEIIKEYAEKYNDKIFLAEGNPTGSAKDNFFYLMKQVEAPIYMFCDQDDVWLENKIDISMKKMTKMIKSYSREIPLMLSTDLKVADENLKVIAESMREYSKIPMKSTIDTNKLLIQNYAVGCTMMINRKLRDMAVRSDNDKIIMHDWWLALIANIFGRYENIDNPTILYRQHGNNEVGAQKVGVRYALDKIKEIKKRKEVIEYTRVQAEALCRHFRIKDKVVWGYAHLNDRSKIYRIYFHVKHGINKCGLLRRIGILLCC